MGVFGATALLKVLRIGDFGSRLDYRRLAGGSALCGIGFTISLYVIDMAMTGQRRRTRHASASSWRDSSPRSSPPGCSGFPAGLKRAAAVA